jgi:acetolactate synthase-1/2/3 large subunit
MEGAKVVVVSGVTSASRRGKGATQETHGAAPWGGLFEVGGLFDDAFVLESPQMLPAVLQRVQAGLSGAGSYVAHIGVPGDVQSAPAGESPLARPVAWTPRGVEPEAVTLAAQRLKAGREFVIWVGFAAREASAEVRALARRTGAKVMCSPRAKGLFPEDHSQFLGVTGFGGHDGPERYIQAREVDDVLVLGCGMGEGASQWSEGLRPRRGIIQVDPTSTQIGGAFPEVELLAISADIKTFTAKLAACWPPSPADESFDELSLLPNNVTTFSSRPSSGAAALSSAAHKRVRPSALMRAVQQVVLDGSDTLVMAESGNAFAWAIHTLCVRDPKRWRVSVTWGAMGHFAAGVIGPAAATGQHTLALVGDGAMLMNHELATAVYQRLPAIWVVLNDSCYNMCKQGTTMQGFLNVDCGTATVHFAKLAQSMGALGMRVDYEHQLHSALTTALANPGPTVIDVAIDADERAPISRRIQSLTWSGPASGP